MASKILPEANDAAKRLLFGAEPPLPLLGDAARRVGGDAAAEQRELLCMLLDSENDLSGFAKRGLLMRVLDLSDVASDLFEGNWENPLLTVSKVYGINSQAFDAAERMKDAAPAASSDREQVRREA